MVATILVRDPWQLLGRIASPSSSLSSPTEDWRVGLVLAEMAEKAVAEMGRRPVAVEAAAKKLLPPIVPDRRPAMEMAPRIMVVASIYLFLQKKYARKKWTMEEEACMDDGQTN